LFFTIHRTPSIIFTHESPQQNLPANKKPCKFNLFYYIPGKTHPQATPNAPRKTHAKREKLTQNENFDRLLPNYFLLYVKHCVIHAGGCGLMFGKAKRLANPNRGKDEQSL